MTAKTLLLSGALSLALAMGIAGGASAASSHDHGHGGAPAQLTLNKGAKWQTDAPARKGMEGVRTDMAAAVPAIHSGKFQPAEYTALAGKLEGHIEYMVANCKLAPEVDEQLHIVLNEVIEGAQAMKGGAHQQDGAVKIVNALDAYGKHFDHPNWAPLAH